MNMYSDQHAQYAAQYGEEGWFGELIAAPLDHRYHEAVNVVHFDQQHEILWAGTEGGMVYTLQCPSLSRYASFQAHPSPVVDLQLLADCAITISASKAAVSTAGGFTRAAVGLDHAEADQWVSAAVEPGTGSSRLLIAGSKGQLHTWDLIANKCTGPAPGELPMASDGFMLLRGPVRGGLAAATAAGRVLLLDARTKWQATASTLAHIGGLSCMEVSSGDLVATAGYSKRMGQLMPDNVVKVFDARNMLRPLSTVMPYAPAELLAWNPLDTTSVMIGSSSGMFAFMDINNPGTAEPYQVDTAGDSLSCAAMSPSGEALVFGGSGGYTHLWSSSSSPRIVAHNRSVVHLKHPTSQVSRHRGMTEQGPFSTVPSPFMLLAKEAAASAAAAAAASGSRVTAAAAAAATAAAAANTRLLSDVPDMTMIVVGQPPRVVDQCLKKDINQVDFVGYIPNPHYSRSKAPGEARKAATPLQHKRLAMAADKGGLEAARAARIQNRLACGGSLLPQRYRRLVIKAQSSLRYEEFDFSYYNKTRFAGLENDLPNCYCNALLQVLYFIPAFREAILQHTPEPNQEFCLTCELLFLFKMLLSAVGGQPCQALNLLRALRQNREAAALGLLEGTIGAGQAAAGTAAAAAAGSGGSGGAAAAATAAMGGLGSPVSTSAAAAAAAVAAAGGDGEGVAGAGGAGGQQQQGVWGSGAAAMAAQSTLPQRMVALCRFLLDHLHKEAGGEAAATAHTGSSGGSGDDSTAAAAAAAAAAAEGKGSDKKHKWGKLSRANKEQQQQKQQQDKAGDQQQQQQQEAAVAKMAAIMQEMFGLVYRSDTTVLSGRCKGQKKSRQLRTFQVDLQYPEPASASCASKAAASPKPTGAAGGSCPPSPLQLPLSPAKSPSPLLPSSSQQGDAAAVTPLNLAGDGDVRPSFGSLLGASLRCGGTNKAWFDESCGYAWVRQERVPLQLPKVLVINCATNNPANVALWRPAAAPESKQQQQQSTQPSDSTTAAAASDAPGVANAAAAEGAPVAANGGTSSLGPTSSSSSSSSGSSWLPWVIQIRSNPSTSQVDVLIASSREGIQQQVATATPASATATYELTAIICHIMDEDEADGTPVAGSTTPGGAGLMSPGKAAGGSNSNAAQQGHAVAVIRVLPPYLDPDTGTLHRLSSAVLQRKASVSQGGGAGSAGGAASAAAAAVAAAHRSGSLTGGGLTGGLTGLSHRGSLGGSDRSFSGKPGSQNAFGLPDNLDDVFAELSFGSNDVIEGVGNDVTNGTDDVTNGTSDVMNGADADMFVGGDGSAVAAADAPGEGATAAAAAAAAAGAGGSASHSRSSSTGGSKPAAAAAIGPLGLRPTSSSNSSRLSPYRQLALEPSSSGPPQQQQQQQSAAAGSSDGWLVINDFSISSIQQDEVMEWYDAQKMPCLLFYTQVSELDAVQQQLPPPAPTPVDSKLFEQLCSTPPLQGASWRGRRSFTPLASPSELPRPGMLVAIDAEFVAVSRAEASISAGQEVQLKPSRLALARVSVLRGSGPSAGVAFIDDYVATVEPVVDYLTRWSGIRPGDLDPSSSTHHLVSLKTAYLKLHHLLDAGCIFVGHGLAKDFRIINLTVPQEQVRDTVELFCFRRQRKLSLRFLASYLLGITIQKGAGQVGAAAAAAAAAATSSSNRKPAAGSSGSSDGSGSNSRTGDTGASTAATAGAAAGGEGGKAGAAQQQQRAGPAAGAAAVAAAAAAAASVQPASQPGHGHDSIEDAATALALYNVYCKLVAEGKLEEKLHEMYRWGKMHGWEPVVWVDGQPQPAAAAAAAAVSGATATGVVQY